MQINKRTLFCVVALLGLCEPLGFTFIPITNVLFKVLKILILIYCIFIYFFKMSLRGRRATSFRWLVLYELVLLVSTLYNHGSLFWWAYYAATFLGVIVVISYCSERDFRRVLQVVICLYTIFLAVNLLQAILGKPFNFNGELFYFLGLRTRVTDSVYVLLCAVICNRTYSRSLVPVLAFILVGFSSLIYFKVSTGIMGLLIFCAVALAFKSHTVSHTVKKIDYPVVALAIYGVVIIRIQERLNSFFELLFHKGADMSYRTDIWDAAIATIKTSWMKLLLGNGSSAGGEWTLFGASYWQAHDQFLQVVLDAGIIGLVVFGIFLWTVYEQVHNIYPRTVAYPLLALLISYSFIMITEIYAYYPAFYLVVSMMVAQRWNTPELAGRFDNSNISSTTQLDVVHMKDASGEYTDE